MQAQQLGPAAWWTARLGATRLAWLACGRSPWACRQAGLPTQNSVACPLAVSLFDTPLACSIVSLACGERCIARQHAVAVHTCRSLQSSLRNSKLRVRPCGQQVLVHQCTAADPILWLYLPCLGLVSAGKPCCQPKLPAHPSLLCNLTPLPGSPLSYANSATPVHASWPGSCAHFPCCAPAGPPAQAAAALHQPPPRGPQSGLPPEP